jgi:hypothetical protein
LLLGQRQRLGIGSRQTPTAATFLTVVVAPKSKDPKRKEAAVRLWGKRLRQIVHEEPPLLSFGAAVGDLEEPNDGSQLIIHGQLLSHLDVGDARGERGDDLLVGDPGDLVPHLTKALDVLMKRLALVLTHRLKIVLSCGALVHGHEVSNELTI